MLMKEFCDLQPPDCDSNKWRPNVSPSTADQDLKLLLDEIELEGGHDVEFLVTTGEPPTGRILSKVW